MSCSPVMPAIGHRLCAEPAHPQPQACQACLHLYCPTWSFILAALAVAAIFLMARWLLPNIFCFCLSSHNDEVYVVTRSYSAQDEIFMIPTGNNRVQRNTEPVSQRRTRNWQHKVQCRGVEARASIRQGTDWYSRPQGYKNFTQSCLKKCKSVVLG